MKKTLILLLVLITALLLTACGKSGETTPTDTSYERVDYTPREGEVLIRATVKEIYGSSLYESSFLIEDESGTLYTFACTDDTMLSYEDEVLTDNDEQITVLDSWDYYIGREISVIASAQMRETYPLGIDVRMIIIE